MNGQLDAADIDLLTAKSSQGPMARSTIWTTTGSWVKAIAAYGSRS